MVHVVICRSLDTEHVSKSYDGEVEHRESLAQTDEYENNVSGIGSVTNSVRVLTKSSVLLRRFTREWGYTRSLLV